ncbi:MAG: hypothetical protein ACJ796_10390 [Gemmatimonadaceae bacterium]
MLTPVTTTGGGSADLNASYPVRAIVNVIASGYVVQHDEYGFNSDVDWGPGGRANTLNPPKVAVVRTNVGGGSSAWQFAFNNNQVADTLVMDMPAGTSILSVVRDATPGLRHWPWYKYWTNQYVYCDTYTSPPCYTFSGSHSISVVTPSATFAALADSAAYSYGSTATITASKSPLTVSGISTPFQIDSALWSRAPDSLGGDPLDTASSNGCINFRWAGNDRVCDRVVKGAGTLTLIGHANGFRVTSQVQIGFRTPSIAVTADGDDLGEGDPITFTAQVTPANYPYQIVGWSWQDDNPGGVIADRVGLGPSIALPAALAAANPLSGSRTGQGHWQRTPVTSMPHATPGKTPNAGPGGPLFDVTPVTDTVNAADEESDLPIVTPPQSAPCSSTTLLCTMALNRSGVAIIQIRVGGKSYFSSPKHAGVYYQCPKPSFPMDYVTDVPDGELALTPKRTWRNRDGLPTGATVTWVRGPWTFDEFQFLNSDKMPVSDYHPTSAFDDVGHTAADLYPNLSFVRFVCHTSLSKVDGKLHGRMEFGNRWHMVWREIVSPPPE